jgi:hypothetical protein
VSLRYVTTGQCIQCHQERAQQAFEKERKRQYSADNRSVLREYKRSYYLSRRDILLDKMKNYRQENALEVAKAKSVSYRKRSDHYKQKARQWRLDNVARDRANGRLKQARKVNATPLWANLNSIVEIYAEARLWQDALGIPMHVDHTIPLKGKNVCGLHVENNLSVMPASWNMRKRNRFDNVDTPSNNQNPKPDLQPTS